METLQERGCAALFDSSEIAKRTLDRVEEIKAEQKRRQSNRKGVLMSSMCVFAVIVLISLSYFRQSNMPGGFTIDDHMRIPLGEFPFLQTDEAAKPFAGTEQVISVPVIGDVSMPAGAADMTITLYNPAKNLCNFVFDIILLETGEYIYSSGLVEPGMCVEDPTLSRALMQGDHDAVLRISVYDKGVNEYQSILDVNFKITIW